MTIAGSFDLAACTFEHEVILRSACKKPVVCGIIRLSQG